jgi:arylformamidase
MPEPTVFLDYTQAALDLAYDQRPWAPTMDETLARNIAASDAVRARLRHEAAMPYGPSPDEVVDVFPAGTANAPVHVFVHGGRWLRRIRPNNHFLAETFVRAGVTFVALGFGVIPDVRLPVMVEQIRRGIAWLHANVARFGGDPGRIHVSGHSSGGHLAAVLLTTDWRQHGLPEDVIKSGVCISGMYDLQPVMLSARGEYLGLSADEIDALSPIRHLDRVRAPITVAYGERESPEFQRQARDFAAALGVEPIRVAGDNHFEILGRLGPGGELARVALDLARG